MKPKVLCVDDDLSLLTMIGPNLCQEFDVRIVDSGQQALELLAEEAGFAVVLTDMQMPQMNGLEFIQRAREVSSELVFIMLTASHDFHTVIDAINQGHVFRFLTKSCSFADMRAALAAAARQHELVRTERQLLDQTFVGAVGVLTDVVEALRPQAIQQSRRVDRIMKTCEAALGGSGSWEYRVAGRLGLVGFALLPQDDQARFLKVLPGNPTSDALLEKIAATSSRLLARIPRLHRVSEIIRLMPRVDGSALCADPCDFSVTAVPAALLRVAIHWTTMTHNGMSPPVALKMLERVYPDLSYEIQRALTRFDLPADAKPSVMRNLSELVEGMVLCQDARVEDGVLLRRGRALTNTMIEKLRMHALSGDGPTVFLIEEPEEQAADEAELMPM